MLIHDFFTSMAKMVDEIASLLPANNDKIKQQLYAKATSLKRMSDSILDEWVKFDEQLTTKIGPHFPDLFEIYEEKSLSLPLNTSDTKGIQKPLPLRDQAFLQGKGYFDLGLFDKSFHIFEQVIGRCPDDELARLYCAYSAMYVGRKEEAVHQFTLLIQSSTMPEIQAVCSNAMGILYFEEQQLDRALQCFSQAIQYDQKLYVARFNLAMAHYCLGNYKEAIQNWEMYLHGVQEQDVELLLYLCSSYLRLGKYDVAQTIIQKFLSDHNGQILLQLGKFYEEAQQYEQAILCYRKISSLEPNNSEALHGIGWNLWLLRPDNQETIPLFKKALSLDPNNSNILFSLAWVFFHENEVEQAKRIVHWLLQQKKPMSLIRSLAFLLALHEDKIEEANEHLRHLQQDLDQKTRALADLLQGKLKLKEKRFEEAIFSFKKAIWNNPNLRESALLQGIAYFLNHEHDKAYEVLKNHNIATFVR